jgi:Tfp pilus assembly protein PilN
VPQVPQVPREPREPGFGGTVTAPGASGFERSRASERSEGADGLDAVAAADASERSSRFPGSFGARLPSPTEPPAAGLPSESPSFVPSTPRAPAAAAAAAVAAAIELESPNLARRPFVNTRPVVRVAAILWVLGALLLAANVALFQGYLTKSQTTRHQLAGIERDIVREQGASAELQGRLGNLSLGQQNREVTFLNRKIDERTFSWSLLFERMAEVLPDQVRLLRLKPTNVVQRDVGLGSRPSFQELNPQPVTLTLHAEAKNDRALLRFVDNMFAHPAFAEPNLQNEARDDNGLVRFDLVVQYQPNPQAARSAAPPTRRPGLAGAAAPAAPAAPGAPGAPAAPGDRSAAGSAPPLPPRPASPAGAGLVRMSPLPALRRPRQSQPAPAPPGAAARRPPGPPGPNGGRR